jgi:hypothetical protein
LAVLDAEIYELLVEIRHVLRPDDSFIVKRVKEEIADGSKVNTATAAV